MSRINHEDFIPHDFVITQFGGQRKPCRQAVIRLGYDPVNFQHLSLIARLFNPAFVNHSDHGDLPGLVSVIEALPNITFALPKLHISLQFAVGREGSNAHAHMDCDLSSFVDAAPCGVNVTWRATLMLLRDTECKITERWQTPISALANIYANASVDQF